MSHPAAVPATRRLTRRVTLVLCTDQGAVLGTLPPFDVPVPYWPETADVVAEAYRLYGAAVTVLRLLETTPALALGGAVSYLAQVAGPPALAERLSPWTGPDPLAERPHRQRWARPGGPAVEVAWAEAALARSGRELTGPPQQVRSWNLSTLWRLPAVGGAAWLKSTPPFFAHEGALIARLDPAAVPALLAWESCRILMAELDGDDVDAPTQADLTAMIDLLVGLQAPWSERVGELVALGLPDWRGEPFCQLAQRTVAASARALDRPALDALDGLLTGLPERFAALADCGIPDTLVHGDFHPGNVRSATRVGPADLRLLDWGDAGVGHPLLDQAAFLQRRTADQASAARAHWARRWREAVLGCEPERAADLVHPIAALRQAAVYQMFLDRIEPDERAYHRDDPVVWLRRAARRFASRRPGT